MTVFNKIIQIRMYMYVNNVCYIENLTDIYICILIYKHLQKQLSVFIILLICTNLLI